MAAALRETKAMGCREYLAVVEHEPGEEWWSITFPDLPGVTSVAKSWPEAERQATDALITAVDFYAAEGRELPPATDALEIDSHVLQGTILLRVDMAAGRPAVHCVTTKVLAAG